MFDLASTRTAAKQVREIGMNALGDTVSQLVGGVGVAELTSKHVYKSYSA